MQEVKNINIIDEDEMSISIYEKKAIYQVRIPSKWFKNYFKEMKRAKLLLAKLDNSTTAIIVIPTK